MKNKKVYGLVGVAALAAIGGTFAYYSAEQTFTNPFNTTNYGSQATEKFNPADSDEWKPGAEVDKDIYATNTGDGDVWVRIKFDEIWKTAGGDVAHASSVNGVYNNLFDITTFDADEVPEALDHQYDAKDGKVTNDAGDQDMGTVVFKNYANTTQDFTEAKKWFLADDGYYYYTSTLTKEEPASTKLLDSVTLCKDTDMGHFVEEYAYLVIPKTAVDENNVPVFDRENLVYVGTDGNDYSWKFVDTEEDLNMFSDETLKDQYAGMDIFTYKADNLDEQAQGYANANYELNITVEFVQADEDGKAALASGWTWAPGLSVDDSKVDVEEP